ncbi:hypothetical protein LTR78_001248 [Recurvomyces mirabilis]|uniref:Uncharacterized protein n=1 Tax=Recurvomyces mirabilis TaxID=574656 RepID=A0AAE1C5H8_9PEZI|nr:hypothetical protein LTR78_001248 [Recurvomyces mirabilis]KAK5161224.1 hypothetical protein LTS14_001020 [Recurvomyces mirabilis]
MATKRALCEIPSSMAQAQKRHRTPPPSHGEDNEHVFETADPILENISTELALVRNIIASLNLLVEAEKTNLREVAMTITDLQVHVAKHERIERDYGWEEKLKAQKAEYDCKVQDLRESHYSKQDLKDQQCKAKIEQLKNKHEYALISKEQSWTEKNEAVKKATTASLAEKEQIYRDKLESFKDKTNQSQVAKGDNWRKQLNELRASHKEQLTKLRANLRWWRLLRRSSS